MKTIYIKTENDYVVDVVTYNPERDDYVATEVESFPTDVLNRSYKLIDGEFILDEFKLRQLEYNYKTDEEKFIRMFVNSTELDDAQALSIKSLYPHWIEYVGVAIPANTRIQYNNKLWKVRQDISQVLDIYYPGATGTEALYEEINETNAGTLEDPIPYDNNMELVESKYYIQSEIVYLCTRSTGVAVYHNLSDLIGIYVELA